MNILLCTEAEHLVGYLLHSLPGRMAPLLVYVCQDKARDAIVTADREYGGVDFAPQFRIQNENYAGDGVIGFQVGEEFGHRGAETVK